MNKYDNYPLNDVVKTQENRFPQTPSNKIVAAAIQLQQEEEEKRQIGLTKYRLYEISRNMESLVNKLRKVRKEEKSLKNKITKLAELEKAFMENGDWDQFVDGLHKN